ncbi:hypothetical protein [Guyparkeria sp. SCN-R1]|uniref:hypothetical protein n=1 Tax=Guyparkeria sp. SCN-R1 TaxID=2341113 RepID=UPI000F655745|nr:hypothetical protein [Guyparkeria sp. SCN-R1]
MICYPADVNEQEILAVNDYWAFSTGTISGFRYTIDRIDRYYRSDDVRRTRPVSVLARKSSFVGDHPAFECSSCRKKIPAENRQDYIKKTRIYAHGVCPPCLEAQMKELHDDARETLRGFLEVELQPEPYLASLDIIDTLSLLTILTEYSNDGPFIASSPDDLIITGIDAVDRALFSSLCSKGALTYISELPVEVSRANSVLFGELDRLTYLRGARGGGAVYRPEGAVSKGVYLNPLDLDGVIHSSGLESVFFQRLQEIQCSEAEDSGVRRIIHQVQLMKLYALVQDVAAEHRLEVAPSNKLRSLLEHLANNYPPLNVHFCFRVKAREVVIYLHTDNPPQYRVKHLFAKFVGDYIQQIESKGWDLKKIWTIPPSVEASPFEALFSRLFLDEDFNWDRLSAQKVFSTWQDRCGLRTVEGGMTIGDDAGL